MIIVNDVFNSLVSMSFQRQALFLSLVVEKMMPNFTFYYGQNQDQANRVNDILEFCFELTIDYQQNNPQNLSDYQDIVETLTPDLDSETGAASYAFDFCVALNALLNFFKESNFQEIENVLEQSIATIDMYVQESLEIDPSDPEFGVKIVENSFMRAEVERQLTLLKIIQSIEVINQREILSLRALNQRLPDMIDLKKIY